MLLVIGFLLIVLGLVVAAFAGWSLPVFILIGLGLVILVAIASVS